MKIGVDIGYVLADRKPKPGVVFDVRNYPNAPIVDGALEGLRQIADAHGAENIFLISRASTRQLAFAIGVWLEHTQILSDVGIPFGNVHICAERSDKATICAQLGIDIMIDDRPEVLSHISNAVIKVAFRPRRDELEQYCVTAEINLCFDAWDAMADVISNIR